MARDCGGGRAVAEKTFEWYREASRNMFAKWVGKLDDDSLPNLWWLARDVTQMNAYGHMYAYYGVLRWRVWSHRFRHACFRPAIGTHAGPNGETSFALYHIKRAIAAAATETTGSAEHCSNAKHSRQSPGSQVHDMSRTKEARGSHTDYWTCTPSSTNVPTKAWETRGHKSPGNSSLNR